MERAAFQLDPLRFALGEKSHDLLVDERNVPQIDRQPLPGRLYGE